MYSDMIYRVLNKNATYSLPQSYCLHRGSELITNRRLVSMKKIIRTLVIMVLAVSVIMPGAQVFAQEMQFVEMQILNLHIPEVTTAIIKGRARLLLREKQIQAILRNYSVLQ